MNFDIKHISSVQRLLFCELGFVDPKTSYFIMEALNWCQLNTQNVCWSCALDEHLIMVWNLKLSNLSKTRPKKNLLLNEIDTLPCCKEVSWVMRCTMYNPTIWMITFSLQAQIPWFILEPFNWRWLNSPKVFLVCEISWAPKGGLRSNMLWKNNPKKRPIQTWFQGESYYLVLFQLASLSFLVFYVTPNNYGKCSRTLNNNFTWAHMEFMCCCQAAIVWAFIQ